MRWFDPNLPCHVNFKVIFYNLIMKCEKCNQEIEVKYGSGRFCSKVCAKSFSTSQNRSDISERVSQKLKGRPLTHAVKGWSNVDPEVKKLAIAKGIETNRRIRLEKYERSSWEELPLPEKRRRILSDQNGCCLFCNINEWQGKNIVLALDHIDGNNKNNARENLRFLCPNCHSQTPTWGFKKRQNVA